MRDVYAFIYTIVVWLVTLCISLLSPGWGGGILGHQPPFPAQTVELCRVKNNLSTCHTHWVEKKKRKTNRSSYCRWEVNGFGGML